MHPKKLAIAALALSGAAFAQTKAASIPTTMW